jgi:DNA-binding Lrp family transcriptional regulator
MTFSVLEQKLLNDFQHNFPLCKEPYKALASTLNCSVNTVINSLASLQKKGVVSRVGVVIKPNSIGVSTLAALCVPQHLLHEVASIVSSFDEVNHNYEREHVYNLWFVVMAQNNSALQTVLNDISKKTGFKVMSLPLERDFHIDLGFQLNFTSNEPQRHMKTPNYYQQPSSHGGVTNITSTEELVIAAVQNGLPLSEKPFEVLGKSIGLNADEIIIALENLQNKGVVKRFGVIVRHHELGYGCNAMVVWNVPEPVLIEVGEKLSKESCVTLCYERKRQLPHWPYNLFSMIHGKNRQQVLSSLQKMRKNLSLECLEYTVLFSKTRFKQRGAYYRKHSTHHKNDQEHGCYA